jgi:hypothetical protein
MSISNVIPELPEKLLSFGGKKLDDEPLGWPEYTSKILEGSLFDSAEIRIVLLPLARQQCHDNAAILWHDIPELEVWTGFALTPAGTWQSHSWCIESTTNIIVETTVPYVKYFGTKLDSNFLKEQVSSHCNIYKEMLNITQDLVLAFKVAVHKTCKVCGCEKHISEFRINAYKRGKVRLECWDCEKQNRKNYYIEHPDEERERAKNWSRENPEQRNATKRAYNKNHPEKVRDRNLKANYGIDQKEYDRLFIKQGGKCAICGGSPRGKSNKFFCVDHCHNTGKVRGLLCSPCNSAIGFLQESAELAQKTADYLS